MTTPSPRPAVSRRGVLTAATATGAATLAAPAAVATPAERTTPLVTETTTTVTPREAAERAIAAASALMTHFEAETDPDMLIEQYPRQEEDPEFAYVWPLSQARAAVTELSDALHQGPPADTGDLDLAEEAAALLRAQEQYWYPEGGTTGLPGYTAATDSEQGAHGDFFYDDNDWIALIELEQHLLTNGEAGDLDRARQLLELFRSGESTDPSLPSPGGIFWTQGDWNDDRNTVSTFPSAKVALRIHQLTGDQSALEDALRWMAWGRETLLAPEEGLFWDNIKLDGSIDRTFWTYNQGVPLGCEVLAYEITGEAVHRENALALVEAIVAHYEPFTRGAELDRQPIQFNAILLSNLLLAESVLGDRAQGRRITEAYAQRLWEDRRDPATDLVTGSRETDAGTHLLDQAGFARTLTLAVLPRSRWTHLS
ncbi:glycoside hydrolase family 76 protein [Brachybacterium sp. YJGR34]|uniref:glycoside hydrolase family 76 protein n=1 Tax=Brachybacterium sp. YJGR34 TaxID=2059911 RepID=UPI000E0C7CF6|nr:glycoside hydrolase family 76 protein [Brachybacterium sp. YJGR34]